MNQSFDIGHACKYGVEEAILIQNLQFWIFKNRANGRHEHGGKTYSSVNAFVEFFPYMTADSIRQTLERLEAKKVIVKGNFNTSKDDQTQWFAFADESNFLPQTLL